MYGITAVMLLALARRMVDTVSSSSIRFSFTGWEVLCTTNTSLPRTLSSTFTLISPSA